MPVIRHYAILNSDLISILELTDRAHKKPHTKIAHARKKKKKNRSHPLLPNYGVLRPISVTPPIPETTPIETPGPLSSGRRDYDGLHRLCGLQERRFCLVGASVSEWFQPVMRVLGLVLLYCRVNVSQGLLYCYRY